MRARLKDCCSIKSARRAIACGVDGLRRLGHNKDGVGAVEFALLMPILVVLYLGAFELTVGLSVAKRTTKAASTIADLVTQKTTTNKTYLASMNDVASAIFVPYGASALNLKITGIQIDASKKATVAWSWAKDGTRPYAVASSVTVPSNMLYASTFLVHTEVQINHQVLTFIPNPGGSDIKSINIAREYYFRPRLNDSIDCTNC
ncbi:MAG: TadE/TadG family type IV pilus assembly protein [Allorhizobium sp.]